MKTFQRRKFKDEHGVEFSACGDSAVLTRMPKDFIGAYRVPDFVSSIGLCAINGCNGLTSLVIPKSVTVIEKDNFELCEQLASLVVEQGNPMFDSRENCNAIIVTATDTLVHGCNSSSIPDSIERIESTAFDRCNRIERVFIPKGTTDYFMRFDALKQYRHRFMEL